MFFYLPQHRSISFLFSLFFILACSTATRQVSGYEGIFNVYNPERVKSTPHYIEFTWQSTEEDSSSQTFYLFVPPETEMKVEIRELEITPVDSDEGAALLFHSLEDAKSRFPKVTLPRFIKVEEMGWIRFNRFVKITIPHTRLKSETQYIVSRMTARLNFEKEYGNKKDFDSSLKKKESSFHLLLSSLIVNPDARVMYASNLPEPAFQEKWTDWYDAQGIDRDALVVKVPIARDDLYIVDSDWMKKAGFTGDSHDLNFLHFYCEGHELPSLLIHDETAQTDNGSQLVVYAEGSDSDFTTTNTLYIMYDTAREGKRIQCLGGVDLDSPTTRILNFSSTARIEEDNHLQTQLGNFLSIKGMNWVWQRIDPTDSRQPELADVRSTFDLPGLVRMENDLPLKVAFYCDSPPEFIPNIKASVVINENWKREFVIHTFDKATFFVTVPADILREKDNILNVTAKAPESTPERPSSLHFDYMEITYPRDFAVVNGKLEFSTDEIEWSHREPAELRIKSSDLSDLYGYFISDLYTVYTLDLRYDVKKQSYFCTLPSDAHGRVISTDIDVVPSFPDPVAVKPNTLRDRRNRTDYLIVSYREYISLLAPLVDLREDSGLEVKVVDVETVYDEFNHGVESPEALKAFFSYALCNWRKPPGYVLLVGDATSDYLNVARNDVINQVPSYTQESENKDDRWASDFWYTTVCGSDLFPDIVVGRLSVCNRKDARVVIEKIVDYEQHPTFGPWRQTTGYIADDGPFDDDCEEIRTQSTPQSFVGKTIYLEEFPWEDNFYLPKSLVEQEKLKISTHATTTLRDFFNNGMVYVTFFGHGSPNIWTDEKIWFGMASKNADSLLLDNREKLTFISNFTCNTGAFDYPIFPWSINISEDMMRVEHGGAIGFFVPSGPGYSYVHRPMAHALHKALFVEKLPRLADAVLQANYQFLLTSHSKDLPKMYVLLGDPMTSLQLPRYECGLKAIPSALNLAREETVHISVVPQRVSQGSCVIRIGSPENEIIHTEMLEHWKGKSIEFEYRLPELSKKGAYGVWAYCWNEKKGIDELGYTQFRLDEPLVRLVGMKTLEVNTLYSKGTAMDVSVDIENLSLFPIENALIELKEIRASETPLVTPYEIVLEPEEKKTLSHTSYLKEGLNIFIVSLKNYSQSVDATQESSREQSIVHIVPVDKKNIVTTHPLLFKKRFYVTGDKHYLDLTVPVYNVGIEEVDRVEVEVSFKGEEQNKPITGSGKRLAPGSSQNIVVRRMLLSKDRFVYPLHCRVRAAAPGSEDVYEEMHYDIEIDLRYELPDVVIEPKDITFEPSSPTDGHTVFIDVWVRNKGRVPVRNVRVKAFEMEDRKKGKEVQDMTRSVPSSIPYIESGSSVSLRLRWDPRNNAGKRTLRIEANPLHTILELDKHNNRAQKSLYVRSKSILKGGGYILTQREEDKGKHLYRLEVVVINEGETDARGVMVNLFKSPKYKSEDIIGEVFLDIIPARSKSTAEFALSLSPHQVKFFRPYYQIFRKGSHQRVSSGEAQNE